MELTYVKFKTSVLTYPGVLLYTLSIYNVKNIAIVNCSCIKVWITRGLLYYLIEVNNSMQIMCQYKYLTNEEQWVNE